MVYDVIEDIICWMIVDIRVNVVCVFEKNNFVREVIGKFCRIKIDRFLNKFLKR